MEIRTKRTILYILALIFVAVNAVIFFRNSGREREQLMNTPAPQVTQAPSGAVSAAVNGASEAAEYVVIAENGYLNLYSSQASAAPEKSERFDTELFPADDVKLLLEGVRFNDIDEAYEFMENFIS